MAMARYDARRALLTGGLLSVVLAVAFLAFNTEASPLFSDLRKTRGAEAAPPLIGVGAAFLVGMGLGSLVTLFRNNWHRMRAVLRPNVGRVISAIVFGALFPIAQFWTIPVVWGFVAPAAFTQIVSMSWPATLLELILLLMFLLVPFVAYLTASLIISGVRSHLVRVALFGQIWLAGYGVTVLLFGFHSGNM